MDSYNYEDLVPGNGTGSIIATAVWNDYSYDGNDADGIIAPTYVSFLYLLSWLMFMSNLHTVAAISWWIMQISSKSLWMETKWSCSCSR